MAILLGLETQHTAQTKLNVAPPPRSRYFLFTFRKMKVWYRVLWNEWLLNVTFNGKNWVDQHIMTYIIVVALKVSRVPVLWDHWPLGLGSSVSSFSAHLASGIYTVLNTVPVKLIRHYLSSQRITFMKCIFTFTSAVPYFILVDTKSVTICRCKNIFCENRLLFLQS